MDWFLGQLAFVYTVQSVRPAAIVDKIIEVWVDLIVPGRGMGERTWWMKGWRSIEQSAEKATREAEIRTDLWNWDQNHPNFHHELIVRYLAGFFASALARAIYNSFRGDPRSRYNRKY